MEKISLLKNSEWVEFSHKAEYKIQDNRLVIGLKNGDIPFYIKLIDLLSEKLYLLYVLHTSRGEGSEGRYQSPLLSKDETKSFVVKYAEFLLSDSRFDFWIHSPGEAITIVLERHNLIYLYGYSDKHIKLLSENKYILGSPSLDFSHQHHYHSEFDFQSKSLLKEFNWSFSELKEVDYQ